MKTKVHPLILARHSSRIIDADKPVQIDELNSMLEAARWAPSCSNNQPWRIVVSRDHSLPQVKSCLTTGNAWAMAAPLILAFVSKPELSCQREGKDYSPLDLGLAIENLLLQGTHLGLVVHPIAGYDEAGVKSALNIPEGYRVYALVIVGHPGLFETADPATQEREQRPRTRKPLDEIVFWERFSGNSTR